MLADCHQITIQSMTHKPTFWLMVKNMCITNRQ